MPSSGPPLPAGLRPGAGAGPTGEEPARPLPAASTTRMCCNQRVPRSNDQERTGLFGPGARIALWETIRSH